MRVLIASILTEAHLVDRLKRSFSGRPDIDELVVAPNEFIAGQKIQAGVDLTIVCVGNSTTERELGFIEQLRGMTDRPLFAAGAATDAKFIVHVIQAGADLFLDQENLDCELRTALRRVKIDSTIVVPAKGRLLAVLSVSGGCGASTIAANLAAVLARDNGSCCLVDLNPGRGDLAALLDITAQYSLAEACRNEARLDRPMFEKLLFRHATGISLLAAPPDFDDVDSLTTRGVDRALEMARALFSQTVVDVEDCFHEEQLTALRQACGILLISRLDFTSLRNARRMLDHLQKHEVERRRIKVVINFHGQSNDLPMNEAQNALGEPLTRFVPYDPRTINSANNMGIPAALKNPATKLSKAIAELAKIDFESSTGASGLLPTLRNIWQAIG